MVEGMVVVHVQYKQRRGNALVIKTTRSKLNRNTYKYKQSMYFFQK